MEIIAQEQRKKTKGRQKIEMKTIQKKSQLQVTFSKRRAGIINKASELSILCGARVAVIAFSPGGKGFAFGSPDVDTVLRGFLEDNLRTEAAKQDPRLQQVKGEYEAMQRKVEEERKRSAEIEEHNKMRESNGMFWWDESIDDMELEELEEYKKGLEELRKNVADRVNEMMMLSQLPSDPTMLAYNYRVPQHHCG